MPIPEWTATQFAQYYIVKDRNPSSPTAGQIFGYGRKFAQLAQNPQTDGIEFFDTRWAKLLTAMPGIQTTDRVLIVGAAFGFTIEAAHAAGYPNVYGIDYSAHVDDNRSEMAEGVVVVAADIRGGGAVMNALHQATGDDRFDWVITEDMASCYSDADIQAFGPILENTLLGSDSSRIIHYTTAIPTGGAANPRYPDMNWKTIEDFAALLPAHTWIANHGHVIIPQ